jgi:LPS-assembly lipoprotein
MMAAVRYDAVRMTHSSFRSGPTRFGIGCLLLSLVAVLNGCGWHLRGNAPLDAGIMPLRVATVDMHSDFYRELHRSLQAAGARTTEDATQAQAVVRVHGDDKGQRILTVSTRNTPEEYEVYYAIDYSVEMGGREVLARQRLELTASYSYDSNYVLAKQQEQLTMQQSLARELSGMVLRSLSAIKPEPPPL